FVAEPDIAKFDFSARIVHADCFGGRLDCHRFIEQLENTLAGGHRRLQNVEFFTEILNWAKEPLRVHRERGQNTKRHAATKNANAARPEDESDRREAQEFNRRVEKRVRENRIAPREHVVAVPLFKLRESLLLSVEELHDAHSRAVFLQK